MNLQKERKVKKINPNNNIGIVVEVNLDKVIIFYNNSLHEIIKNKNILYPGDKVSIKNNKIINILPRKNILSRNKKDNTSKKEKLNNKVIATNIDLAIIVVSSKEPPLHPKLIDRYIILLKENNIPYIICINKSDLIDKNINKIIKIYEKINIPIIKTSTITKEGIDKLRTLIKNKQSILVGHSGVGKSSLINTLLNKNITKTGKLSHQKGCHTTTKTKYYKIDEYTSILDTPGIKSLDLSYLKKDSLKNYFEEFIPYNNLCKYKNCLHQDEPISTCKIKQLVKDEQISKERYESYLKILNETK